MGSLAGSALFPTQLPAGPRITDNRTTTATIGVPVPILFGTADLAGTVIWLAPMIEHSSEQGGKGGPQQKVFNYTQSIAIGLCERVDDTAAATVGAIGGLTRIWENGTIVYDIRPQQEANTELGTVAETDEQYANRLSVSADYAEGFTLYLGDENQEADPTIEAVEGLGNVPGFRGLAYIVYPNRNLQNAQGLRHPSFTFECFQDGTGTCTDEPKLATSVLYRWNSGGTENPVNGLNVNTYAVLSFETLLTTAGGDSYLMYPDFSVPQISLEAALGSVLPYYKVPVFYVGYASGTVGGSAEVLQTQFNPGTAGTQGVPTPNDYLSVQKHQLFVYYNVIEPINGYFTGNQVASNSVPYLNPQSAPVNESWHAGPVNRTLQSFSYTWPTVPAGGVFPPYPAPYVNGAPNTLINDSAWIFWNSDVQIEVTRSPSPPNDPCLGLLPATTPGYAVLEDGRIIKCNTWSLVAGPYSGSYKSMSKFDAAATTNSYPWDPTLHSSDPNFSNATFWTDAYNALVAADKMPAGLVYGTDYPVVPSAVYEIDQVICEGSGVEANVADITRQICKRAGLTDSQIDVSDLTTSTVGGYSISGICDGSDIIAPLRSIAFFDCVDSGNTLRFPTRGKEVVATLTADQIGCFDGGSTGGDGSSSTNVPASIAVVRQDETTLPRSIRLHYKATSREYQDAEQDSPFRLTTRAVDDQDISIPLCIGDVKAAKSAEILWADAWAAQNSYTLAVDQSLAALEGADCIGVPVNGVIQRMRIVSDSNASFVLRKLSLVADDQGSYISFAVASPPIQKPSTLTFLSPTLAVFLNIPSLMDSDNNAGFYVVAYPDPNSGNKWNGATFYQSIDGTNFSQSVSSTQAGTVGTLDTAVLASESFTWDTTTIITVNLPISESFESRTDDAVLAGANAAAMGADGRWEIIQFATATQITPTQWQLSRLLRGRRGTEHVMGSSQAGDQFVLVSTGDLVRVPLSVSQIGASYVYKVVSVGAAFSTGNTYDFVSRGTALVPFAPVDALATSSTGGDIEISWTRRDRLGETLMSGMDVPLSDFPESFQVDIVEAPHSPSSPTVVFRTLTTGTTSVIYSAADFAADYPADSPGGPIYVRIYQMSLTMGRGTPLVATLEVT